MKKFIKIAIAVILTACVCSLIPVVGLYIGKEPAPYSNAEAVKRIANDKADYFGFMVFSDNHAGLILDDSSTLRLVKSMNRETRFKKMPIGFVISAGDLTFRGSPWDYSVFNKIRALIKYPVISAIGNHDDDKGSYELFKKYVGEDKISFAYGNSYFMILNNITGDFDDEQFAKLEAELSGASSYKHRFIIMHKPPFAPYQQSWYRPELSQWSYRFLKLCEKYKIDMVFSGHEHMYKEKVFGAVRYIVSGGGGMIPYAPREDGGFIHYIVVKVNGDYVDYEVRKIQPPVWEFFTYYLWKDLFYFLKSLL